MAIWPAAEIQPHESVGATGCRERGEEDARSVEGAGRPVGVYLVERVLDEAARVTGLDPAEIRRGTSSRPTRSRTARRSASPRLGKLRARDRARELSEYPALRRAQVEARGRGEIFGIGVATYVESTNVQGWERRDLVAASQTEAAAGLALDGHARQRQVLDVAVDRALGDAQTLGEPVASQDLAASQQQDEL